MTATARLVLALALLLGLGACPTAISEPQAPDEFAAAACAPAGVVGRSLAARFGEAPAGFGRHDTEDGRGWVLMVGPASWSAVELHADGSACLVAWGVPLRGATPVPRRDGADD